MDVKKRLESMRLTEKEWEDIVQVALDKITPKKKTSDLSLVMALETMEEAKAAQASEGKILGLSTGFPSIDQMTKGINKGDLVIIYGDTSHGKSQLTQNIAYNLARSHEPVLFIGLEMTNAQNTGRFMRIGQNDPMVEDALANILYPSSNDLRLENIEEYITSSVGTAKLVVIDQLQQLTRSVDNTTSETSLITHELKRMAIRHGVPIILISHINRSSLNGGPPTLRELKGSSSIEQDADICLAVWRDMDPQHMQSHILEIVLRKNRNRGMEHTSATLTSTNGVKLAEVLG